MSNQLSAEEIKALFPNASTDLLAANAALRMTHQALERSDTTERLLNPAERRREIKELHRPFMQWLDRHEIPYVNPRSDRSTGITPGWPDFTILSNFRGVCVEFKWPGCKLSADQSEVHALLVKAGVPVITATSVEEAMQFVRAELLVAGKEIANVYK